MEELQKEEIVEETEEKKWCVYMHTNKINNKVYVGITNQNPENRWGSNGCRYNLKTQPAIAGAIKKYGWDNFEHIIFAEDLSEEDAKNMEIELIALYKSNCSRYNNPSYGYNMTDGGDGSAGREWTEESRNKLSKTRTGHPTSEETKIKISKANKGRKFSEEVRKKFSESHIGVMTGEKHPNYGKPRSAETKEKLRKAALGRKMSEETKRKIGEASKNRVWTEESRKKISEALKGKYTGENSPNYGRRLSEEQKSNLSKLKSIPVVQLTNNGEFIAEYPSIKVAEQTTGVSHHVNECCRGTRETCGGFRWMYKEEYEKQLQNLNEVEKEK